VSTYRKLIWIILLAIAVRVAVRGYLGGPNFWENGYTFLTLAKYIAAVAFVDGTATAFQIPLYPMFVATATPNLASAAVKRGGKRQSSRLVIVATPAGQP
jgi:hypothetical protein